MSPLPMPDFEEKREAFMERCMSHHVMVAEFPDDGKRQTMCGIQASDIPLDRAGDAVVSRAVDMAQMKVDAGTITGYALTWAFDADGYQFERGSFAKTIQERTGKIPLLIAHAKKAVGRPTSVLETVGFLTALAEDDTGLLVTAPFLETELAQTTREQAMAGGIKSMSVGTRPLKYTQDGALVRVSEAKLIEVTLTNIPVDDDAEILTVRSEGAGAATAPLPVTPEPPVRTDTPEAAVLREQEITLLELGDTDVTP